MRWNKALRVRHYFSPSFVKSKLLFLENYKYCLGLQRERKEKARKEGRKKGRKDGRKEERMEGRKERGEEWK